MVKSIYMCMCFTSCKYHTHWFDVFYITEIWRLSCHLLWPTRSLQRAHHPPAPWVWVNLQTDQTNLSTLTLYN